MKCPICNVDLQMAERQGIEIDYCPQCRGVWLDRGELDKIIEKSAASNHIPERNIGIGAGDRKDYGGHDDRRADQGYAYGKKHKRESLLGELFDF
ncbi:MAG: zf-TFIIB domain-containing protein [Candidatus Moranbacteria bacterium]|nr:zf-TFIIB domain-containing protein [Candidatus Moranbacteria bacterium]